VGGRADVAGVSLRLWDDDPIGQRREGRRAQELVCAGRCRTQLHRAAAAERSPASPLGLLPGTAVNRAAGPSGDLPVPSQPLDDGTYLSATVYLAICLPPDTMPGGLAEIQLALADAARSMTRSGHPVRYLNGMYMPAQTRLLCVFAGESERAVHATVELVGLPFVRIRAITDR
jgi:hypothetical protein